MNEKIASPIRGYYADCGKTKCVYEKRLSDSNICPECGTKMTMYPMVAFGGLDIVFDNYGRFWLINGKTKGPNYPSTEIDCADVCDTIEFMSEMSDRYRQKTIK